ncbi:hypothetical protein [Acetobacter sp.]|uniref:hypothetical protein n=1 Tax=Acetobacter sp. TaxID=440 RepID=UPI0039EBD8B3
MTLAAILAPLLALCVVARGIGFLSALGVVSAIAMLVDGTDPLHQAGAAFALLFAIGPVWFLSYYQQDSQPERSGPAVPFLALGLMVVLMLAGSRPGVMVFPAGLCIVLAGLVAVTCRQSMVWQWAGLLTCVEGVLLSGIIQKHLMVVGVTVLAGLLIAALGGMCVHRVLPRLAVVRASGRRQGSKRKKGKKEQGSALGAADAAPHPDYVPKPPRYDGADTP